mmetsp:Transcript_50732/g.56655  ORF Transcript_50732/g.56655 Transcript_50732/m.56655 type:complete len:102 (-) Transcript_50732:212-517(-)|eukprot:CAMPEP_0170792334 /NCGR_PEP_ID=MMETSP0733-20121128/21819_1 /TAXON_ID=186038 /ORGANISM="Fragilariopsis kerguelensis, Strain L26-C5" /LENGTH=101 /DNA_ID=CAMNT_0011140717 /DNA_START=359 /DNA_END=667 /DNA_ORIENTATION=+
MALLLLLRLSDHDTNNSSNDTTCFYFDRDWFDYDSVPAYDLNVGGTTATATDAFRSTASVSFATSRYYFAIATAANNPTVFVLDAFIREDFDIAFATSFIR